MATAAYDDTTRSRTFDRRWTDLLAHVSWGAVFAGLVLATALQVTLTVLGTAIGLTALDGPDSPRAFGIGTAIWALAVPLVTLFLGGATTGRLANVRDRRDAFIHGALLWSTSLLLATWLLGTAASRVLGGTLSLAGDLTGGAVSAVSDAAGAVASREDVGAQTVDAVRERIAAEARERGVSEDEVRARTEQLQAQAGAAADRAQGAAAGGAWLALLALGLSLGAAVLGAMRGMRDRVVEPARVAS